ncbi:MAG: acetyl-CoA carboxylase biotin carboxylase subunit [Bacteroidota bacterium]|nr:acetyl-CoA carboxylase biotin carboxylase subunit [Bacteroidota bacterium]
MKRKIKKILIANRGEIAVRIHRSAKELGIVTVAIFSDPDRLSPHVLLCDEAYPLHGISSQETYLNQEKILSIAKSCRVDAIHPGYGFLSEKSQFAKAVLEAGFIFIGPTPETIELLGSKTSARDLLKKKNLPIVPGSTKPISDFPEAAKMANEIGLPIMVKAAGGGGGKGMRRVDKLEDLNNAIERARAEAGKSFSDDRVYLEKFIVNPKHIEIQILADTHGNVIHLGERECSIQRRHQKVVEECPSSVVTSELREKMGRVAVEIAKASGYVNAGTVEFLLDTEKNFYFLEVNTRLQVEHPVTELVYGLDLVKEQIRIAEGEKLSISQSEIKINGCAIECRISAEETDNNFMPSTGEITHYQPSEGPGVRNDSGVRGGTKITMHYDPMMAKLIVHGKDRKEAISRMVRALDEYKINGVKTTIPFCQFVLSHKEFIGGTYNINFTEQFFTTTKTPLTQDGIASLSAAYMQNVNGSVSREKKIDAKEISSPSKWKGRERDE